MSQSKSLDQLHQECCDELRAVAPGGQRGPAVSRAGGTEWLSLLGPVAGVVWSLLGTLIAKLMFWNPQKAQLEEVRADLDKALQEMRKKQATALSPETLRAVTELKPLLEQLLLELRGKVTPDALNGARDEVYTQLAELGLPDTYAEEAAHIVTDKVGKPLLAPPGQEPSGPGHPGQSGPA